MRNPFLPNQKGFTLVEIISVLILLGILAAVAVPRFLDLEVQARTSAAQAAVAEIKGQASKAYGIALMKSGGSTPAIDSIIDEVNTDLGGDFVVTAIKSGTNEIIISVSAVQGKTLDSSVTGTWKRP